ncbi:hypothetical protein HAX54_017915 [Datura stramonium]|uniref:F-box associated beta-propeller type 3 domain-containing protein n=1 Tax=Datura stramonium TaxID=4076 RepID=A0ABS8RJ62_DATST|nr:hypothetical protein [Datura stramonium]
MEKEKNPSIPQEIIFEIWSWLPAKSLMRFKCLTRFCNSLVSESDFVDIHSYHSMTRPGGKKFLLHGAGVYYTAEEKKDGKASVSVLQIERFDELNLHVPAYSCLNCVNGLFCIWGPLSVRPATIFNPSTRELRFLPNLNEDFVRPNYSLALNRKKRSTNNHECAIAAFDVKPEKFEIIALWNASLWGYNYELIEVKGKLAVINYGKWVSGYFDLWILEQTPKREWQRHTIHFPSTRKDTQYSIMPCFASHDGEIVVIVNLKSVLYVVRVMMSQEKVGRN